MLKASNSVECSSDKVKLQFKGNPFEKEFFFFRQRLELSRKDLKPLAGNEYIREKLIV